MHREHAHLSLSSASCLTTYNNMAMVLHTVLESSNGGAMSNVKQPYRWTDEMRLAATALFKDLKLAALPRGCNYKEYAREFLARHCMVQVDETTMDLAPTGERPSDSQLRRVWNALRASEHVSPRGSPTFGAVREPEHHIVHSWPRPHSSHDKPSIEAFAAALNREMVRGYRGLHTIKEVPLSIAIPGAEKPIVHAGLDAASGTLGAPDFKGTSKSSALGNRPVKV